MNKLLTKIVGIALGATMAIGVGVAIGSASKGVFKTEAAISTADDTLTFSEKYNSNTEVDNVAISQGSFTATFNKRNGGTATQYYTSNSGIRWYGGGTLVVASATRTLTAIDLIFTQTANSISTNVGSYSLANSIGSWTGTASSVTFSQTGTSGHCRISQIKVVYQAQANLPTVTITNETISGKVGDIVDLTCTTTNATGLTLEWSAPENSIAEIIDHNEGKAVKFVKSGNNVDITASLKDGGTLKASDTKTTSLLVPEVTITGENVSNNKLTIAPGSAITLGYTPTNAPASNCSYSWSHNGSSGEFNTATLKYSATTNGNDTVTVTMKYGEIAIASNTLTIKVSTEFNPATGAYHLISSTNELSDGDHIIIVNQAADIALNTTQNSGNRSGSSISYSGEEKYILKDESTNTSIQSITIEKDGNYFKFCVGDDAYLYASSGSSNQLKTTTASAAGNNGKWAISINAQGAFTITAQGSNSRNTMRYNPNSGNPIFACYASSSTTGTTVAIYLHKTFEKEALDFSSDFLSQTSGYCTASLSTSVKNDLKAKYDALTDISEKGAKQLFDGAAIVRGKGQTYANDISEALSRYINMIEEKKEDNFLGLSNAVLSRANPGSSKAIVDSFKDSTAVTVMIIISTIGIIATGGYFFLRKRKEVK